MKHKRAIWAVGGTMAALVGALAQQACGASTSTPGTDGGADTGVTIPTFDTGTIHYESSTPPLGSGTGGLGTGAGSSGTGSGGGDAGTSGNPDATTDAPPQGDSGSATDSGSDAHHHDAGQEGDSGACDKPPPGPYAELEAGVYCPFSAPDGGHNEVCRPGQHCCEPSTGTSTCVAAATACGANDTNWECEGPLDCANSNAGHLCCGTGEIETQAPCGSYPAFPYVKTFTGSSCAAACTAFVICSQTSDCKTAGETCVAIRPKGNDIGYCAAADAGTRDAGHDAGTHDAG
jgi:hypothetical protein